ncbi:MAG: AAA family ATPase, partial [Clostridia bacterium]|nr:AAA family ATPase [Clostridia bacterium]
MRIISIHIESFGLLEERRFDFSPGMNILEGHNESGKSTLLAFIKFMFYGASNRAVGEGMSERARRLNWKTGRAAGSMTVETAAGSYRIERSLARTVSGSGESSRESYTENLQIVDLESGAPLPRGTQPGEYFLGVPAIVFESTAYVRQLGSTGIDGTSVSEALENLLTSASESSNTTRALTRLDSARKALLHKNARGGEIYTLQTERTAVIGRLERAKTAGSERIAAQNLLDGLKKSAAESREKLNLLNARCDACDALMLLRRFESLHALEQKSTDLRQALAQLHADEGADGFLPDRAYAARLRELERKTAAAEADCARTETELARMRFEQPGKPEMAAQAAEIRTAGGIDVLTEEYDVLSRQSSSFRLTAILCFILSGLCLAGGAAAGILLNKIGYIVAAASLMPLAAGILFLSVSRRRRSAIVELCRKFGLSAAPNESDFAKHLAACFEEEEQLKGYAEVLIQVERDLESKQNTLDALRREVMDTLARWNITVRDGGLAETLTQAIPRAERVADTADELSRDLAKYDSVLQSTTAELE